MKKRETKEIFAEALLALSAHRPVDKITVRQIVEESGLSQQTFYNHFKDKHELILWIHKAEGDRMLAKLGKDGYGYDELVRDNISFYVNHKEFMHNALNNTYGSDSYAEQSAENAYRMWKNYITVHRNLTELPEEIDFYLKMFCHATVKMMAEWAFHMEAISAEQFARYMREGMPEKLKPYLLGIKG